MGINETIQIDKKNPDIHKKKIMESYPKGFDIIIDATGADSITQDCVHYAKMGRKIVVYGVCKEEVG